MKKSKNEKEKFVTGSIRDTSKGKPSYMLVSPIALNALATHCTEGASHYGARNWEKGQPLSRILDSLLRHLQAEMMGMEDDSNHASAILWNAMAYVHTKIMVQNGDLPAALDDMPKYSKRLQEKLNWNLKKK